MAWYTAHEVHFRGRLVKVESRYGRYNGAVVLKGKPLDLQEGSRDDKRLKKLFEQNTRIQREIKEFLDGWNDHCDQYS